MDKIKETIKEFGVAIIAMQLKGHAGTAYTIGLTQAGVPELYCTLPPNDPEVIQRMLKDMNDISALMRKRPEDVRSGICWVPEEGASYAVKMMKPQEPLSLTEAKRLYPLGYQVLEMVYEPR